MPDTRSLDDVIKHIKADQSWLQSRGDNIHIAIVDTGICQQMAEFPAWKRSYYDWPDTQITRQDQSHGTMMACIAAGTKENGGRFNGVAPAAKLISCPTNFSSDNLCSIYQYLIDLVERGKIGRLVINNSYGLRSSTRPKITPDDPFIKIVRRAVECGIVVIFPAGNNHVRRCGYAPEASGPNSIWGVNSIDEVITVAAVDEFNRMNRLPQRASEYSHCDSSRGPGQLAQLSIKPDCCAPCYGEIAWGCRYMMKEWWGTSGAAAQVSGLSALLLALNDRLTPDQIKGVIKKSCVPLLLPPTCVGAGLIDCQAALALMV